MTRKTRIVCIVFSIILVVSTILLLLIFVRKDSAKTILETPAAVEIENETYVDLIDQLRSHSVVHKDVSETNVQRLIDLAFDRLDNGDVALYESLLLCSDSLGVRNIDYLWSSSVDYINNGRPSAAYVLGEVDNRLRPVTPDEIDVRTLFRKVGDIRLLIAIRLFVGEIPLPLRAELFMLLQNRSDIDDSQKAKFEEWGTS